MKTEKRKYTQPPVVKSQPRYVLRAEHFQLTQGHRFVWCLYDTQNMRLEGQTGQTLALAPNSIYTRPRAKPSDVVAYLRSLGIVPNHEYIHIAPTAIIANQTGQAYLALAN